jgi:hypothetical protein
VIVKKGKMSAECNSLYIVTRQFCVFSEDGVAVAQIRIDMPAQGSTGVVAKYYSKISKAQEEYVDRFLSEQARAEYEQDTDPRKRFSFKRYRYFATLEISCQTDEYISVLAQAKLTRGGSEISAGVSGRIFTAEGVVPPIEFGVRRLMSDEVLILNSDAVPCLRKYKPSGSFEVVEIPKKIRKAKDGCFKIQI